MDFHIFTILWRTVGLGVWLYISENSKLSPLLNKNNRSLREKIPNPQRLWCKEVCIYISFIYAFVLTTNMCLETQEKISYRVPPLQPFKDHKLDHPVSWKSLTSKEVSKRSPFYSMEWYLIFHPWISSQHSAKKWVETISCEPHVLHSLQK